MIQLIWKRRTKHTKLTMAMGTELQRVTRLDVYNVMTGGHRTMSTKMEKGLSNALTRYNCTTEKSMRIN